MTTLNIILTSILVLCSIVLIAAVLMQQTKSSGLGGAFAGDTQSFKITVVAAIIIGVLAILIMILA